MNAPRLSLKIALLSTLVAMPTFATDGAAGFDLKLPEAVTLYKDSSVVVDMQIATEIPEGYYALILPRSGLGFAYGVELANTVAVIDSDYRGAWMLKLTLKEGVGEAYKEVPAGTAIVQVLLVQKPVFDLVQVAYSDLDKTVRGEAGLGSTGLTGEAAVGTQAQAASTSVDAPDGVDGAAGAADTGGAVAGADQQDQNTAAANPDPENKDAGAETQTGAEGTQTVADTTTGTRRRNS